MVATWDPAFMVNIGVETPSGTVWSANGPLLVDILSNPRSNILYALSAPMYYVATSGFFFNTLIRNPAGGDMPVGTPMSIQNALFGWVVSPAPSVCVSLQMRKVQSVLICPCVVF